jgi:hypothetical protein
MNEKASSSAPRARVWSADVLVPLIVLVGIAIGVAADLAQGTQNGNAPPPFGPSQPGFNTVGAYHVILSTLGIVLLLALLTVYARTYRQTHGLFPLGLIVVFSSLLFQEVVSSPLFAQFFEHTPLVAGAAGPVADTFRIIAYIVFLWISLQ